MRCCSGEILSEWLHCHSQSCCSRARGGGGDAGGEEAGLNAGEKDGQAFGSGPLGKEA